MNLHRYIQNWLFLNELDSNLFDIIIFESFHNYDLIKGTHREKKVTLLKDFWFTNFHNSDQKILFVMNKINTSEIATLKNSNITILNPSWLTSIASKIDIENNDLDLLMANWRSVYEPYNQSSLQLFLKKWKKTLIKIYDKEYSNDILPIDDKTTLYAANKIGAAGDDATLITSAAYLGETSSILNNLSSIDQKSCDLFIILKYNFKITKELIESIERTEKVILIIDQLSKSEYIRDLIEEFWRRWIRSSTLKIMTPKYDKIKSILPDFMSGEASFDSIELYSQANEFIPTEK